MLKTKFYLHWTRLIFIKKPYGKDIILGIDLDLQEFMEKEFAKDKTSGAFIALDPKSGLIKTIVSFPAYSLNTFSSQISQELWTAISTNPQKPLTNKTIAGVYPPGSTFKVVSSMAFWKVESILILLIWIILVIIK